MKATLPLWSIPLLLVVMGIILWAGNLSTPLRIVVALETVGICGYLVWRGRHLDFPKPISNVLPLFPGHLLLLLAVTLLPSPDSLAGLWIVLPLVSVLYDQVTVRVTLSPRLRTSILIGLYCILWADLFVLIERVISIKRGFTRSEEVIAVAAFGTFGILFLSLGIYRHSRAGKE